MSQICLRALWVYTAYCIRLLTTSLYHSYSTRVEWVNQWHGLFVIHCQWQSSSAVVYCWVHWPPVNPGTRQWRMCHVTDRWRHFRLPPCVVCRQRVSTVAVPGLPSLFVSVYWTCVRVNVPDALTRPPTWPCWRLVRRLRLVWYGVTVRPTASCSHGQSTQHRATFNYKQCHLELLKDHSLLHSGSGSTPTVRG